MGHIPFNRPFATGNEFEYIREAIANRHLSGDGAFTRRCHGWLEQRIGCRKAFLTHSCTAALEMAAILADIQPGDEVIMPSFTFVSTANAVVLRGGVPVFVDIRPDTLNLDESRVSAAITDRTKAIIAVHYAGVGCEMDELVGLANDHGLLLVEDAAQALLSLYRGRALGSIGHLAAISFHETKNVISGEGGAILINDVRWVERAEMVREKGTNRGQFFRGQADKYTWHDIGSSYLPSEITAAFLWAQLEQGEVLTSRRVKVWNAYHETLEPLEAKGKLRRPIVPSHCRHNAHMYYILLPDLARRTFVLDGLKRRQINAVFHYVPLHSSPAGQKYGRTHGDLSQTQDISDRLVRLPLWIGMEVEDVVRVADAVADVAY